MSRLRHEWLTWGAVFAVAGLVVVLGIQNRRLRAENRKLVERFTEPHRGVVVPTFEGTTLDGDTVTVGEAPDSGRQVLFVFTTTCPYCVASLPAWRQIAATIQSAPSLRAQVLGVSLDSAAVTRRYATAHGLRFPILTFPARKLSYLYRARSVPQTLDWVHGSAAAE
jgi:peroxiredoxin